jgi:hypothetical protein
MTNKLFQLSSLTAIIFSVILFIGCEQKSESPDTQNQQPADTQTQQTPQAADTQNQAQQKPDLSGEWEGKFGDRKMTLTITSFDGNTFEGETLVRWDPPKKEKVTGEMNFDTREMKIKETGTRKSNGNYTGTVSADMKTFNGVWKDNGDRISYNINLTKK